MTAVMSEDLPVTTSASLPHRPARFYPGRHGDRALVRAARPVLDQLVQDLAGARMSVVVTNALGQVVDSGRSDPSPSVRPGRPADTAPVSAATAPISDPSSGHTLGAIDLTSEAAEANPLMHAVAKHAAREIEQRLVDDAGVAERLLLRARNDARAPGSRPTFGWDSLTDTERAVTELVTDGFTNQEAAERLFMSRHTVGSHLRSIFRKLDVGSRVDLTRLVTARATSGD